MPDADLGESVVAALVPDGAALNEDAIKAHVATALARFKNPKRYVVLDALPRNTMGKVQKTTLRAEYGTM